MARVLVLAFSPLDRDPRVLRHIQEIVKKHEVTTVGFGKLPIPVEQVVDISQSGGERRKAVEASLLASARYRTYLAQRFSEDYILERLKGQKFDLVIANDVETAPLALELAKGQPVWLDLHEYAFGEMSGFAFSTKLLSRLRRHLARTYVREARMVSTVSAGIAALYQSKLELRTIEVIPNAASYRNLEIHANDPGPIRLIYHGIADRERGVEQLISAMGELPKFYSLTLMLVGTAKRVEKLRSKARGNEVRFLDPVAVDQIPSTVNAYDLFVYGLQPESLNARHALPNKFFENVQARIGQVLTPTSGMLPYLEEFKLGRVSRGFSGEDLAEVLNDISYDEILDFKRSAHGAAHALAWERFAPQIHQVVGRLIGDDLEWS